MLGLLSLQKLHAWIVISAKVVISHRNYAYWPGLIKDKVVLIPYLLPTKSLCIDKEKVGRR